MPCFMAHVEDLTVGFVRISSPTNAECTVQTSYRCVQPTQGCQLTNGDCRATQLRSDVSGFVRHGGVRPLWAFSCFISKFRSTEPALLSQFLALRTHRAHEENALVCKRVRHLPHLCRFWRFASRVLRNKGWETDASPCGADLPRPSGSVPRRIERWPWVCPCSGSSHSLILIPSHSDPLDVSSWVRHNESPDSRRTTWIGYQSGLSGLLGGQVPPSKDRNNRTRKRTIGFIYSEGTAKNP